MPRVSVITAAHNAARYLDETLRSVASQTFGDWEVVVVDDASTDGTGAVAERHDRVRLVRSERPLGPGAARSLAMEEATGELLATLDADDMWSPHYLESQLALYDRASRERRVGLVCCDARLLGPDGIEADTFADRTGRPPAVFGTKHLLRANVVFTSVLIPRAVLEDVGGYDAELRTSEDYDLWLRVAEAGYEVVWNAEPLAVYRLRPDSLAASASELARSTADVYSRSLTRGRLSRSDRRLARRQRRLYRFLAWRAETRRGRAGRLAALPLTALIALEHPERWRSWLRQGGPRRRGAGGSLR